jgi:short-subunit dehydrogenase
MKALITGASSGFGAEFAKQLAKKWYDLILVARNEDKLKEIWDKLSLEYSIKTQVFKADLGTFKWIESLCYDVIDKEDIDLLINNAGRWNLNGFLSSDFEDLESMMVLNMWSATLQSQRIINKWIKEERSGKIINLASLASFLFDWTFPLYSPTRTFIRGISYWLDSVIEDAWASDKIKIQCLCPGFTKTNFFAGEISLEDMDKLWFMEPREVVKESLDALERNEFLVIPWEKNKESAEYYKNTDPFKVRKETKQLVKDYNLHF